MGVTRVANEYAKKKEEARQLLIKSRLYRIIAVCMLGFGMLILSVVYFRNVQGHEFEVLLDPGTIGMVLVPFIPAVVFATMTGKAEKKLDKILGELGHMKAGGGTAGAAAAAPKKGRKK